MSDEPVWKLSAAEQRIYDAVAQAGSPMEVALDVTHNELNAASLGRLRGKTGWIACYSCRDVWVERAGELETGAKLAKAECEAIVEYAIPTSTKTQLSTERKLRLRQRVVRRVDQERHESGYGGSRAVDFSSRWQYVDHLSRERDEIARWFDERIFEARRVVYPDASKDLPPSDHCDGILADRSKALKWRKDRLLDEVRDALKLIELCDDDWDTAPAIRELYVIRWVL